MKIEFYIPKDEEIPTRLRLKVDDSIDVYDHGAQWRECEVRDIVNDEYSLSITVYFRVSDSY